MNRRHRALLNIAWLTVLLLPAAPLLGQWRGCYNSEAERSSDLRGVRQDIQEARAKKQEPGSWSYNSVIGLDSSLRMLQAKEREMQATPLCSGAIGGYRIRGGYDIPRQDLARAAADITEHAQRESDRAAREIEGNRQYYASESERIRSEFSTANKNLEAKLQAIEARERGAETANRAPDQAALRRQAEQRAAYAAARQELLTSLIGSGVDPAAADGYLAALARSNDSEAGIDAAIQDPGSFTPGSAFRGYPESLSGRPLEVPPGAMPPVDPLDRFDPLMNPNGGTLEELYRQKEARNGGVPPAEAVDPLLRPNGGTLEEMYRQKEAELASPAAQAAAEPIVPPPGSDAAQPGYAEAVAEMREQDAAYSAKIQAEMSDPNSRSAEVMRGDWSGVGKDMGLQPGGIPATPGVKGSSVPSATGIPVPNQKTEPTSSTIVPAGKAAPVQIARSSQIQSPSAAAPAAKSVAAPAAPPIASAQTKTSATSPATALGPGVPLEVALGREANRVDWSPQANISNPISPASATSLPGNIARTLVSPRTEQVLRDLWLEGQIPYDEYQRARDGKTEDALSILKKAAFQTIDDLGSLAGPLLGKTATYLEMARHVDRANTIREVSTDPSLADLEKAIGIFKTSAEYLPYLPLIGPIIGPQVNSLAIPAMEQAIRLKKQRKEYLESYLESSDRPARADGTPLP